MFSAIFLRRIVLSTAVATSVAMSAKAFAGAPVVGAGPGLTVTPAGANMGLSVQTFATGLLTANNDPNGIGALGVAVDSQQRVYVTDYVTDSANHIGGTYVFPNRTNGQDASSLSFPNSITPWGTGNATGITQLNGHVYMTSQGASQLFDLNTSGYKIGNSLWAPWTYPSGIVANPNNTGTLATPIPNNGIDLVHPGLFFSLGADANQSPAKVGTIEFMDPIQAALQDAQHPGDGVFVTSGSAVSPNSLAISADGGVLASVWSDGTIRFYSTGHIPTSFTDTIATLTGAGSIIMGSGAFSNMMFVSNGSEIDEISIKQDATFGQVTVVATGGAYGGYLSADPFSGNTSLFVTESGTVYRLNAAGGGAFVSAPVPSAVPEPAAMSLLAIGSLSLLSLRGKKKV